VHSTARTYLKRIIGLFVVGTLLASSAWAGPVVIDGTDANDHGSAVAGANVDGWLYMQKVLENLAGALTLGVARVVVDLGTTSGQARDAIESAFMLSALPGQGWTLVHVDGAVDIEAWLTGLSVVNTGILYIPTAGNTGGDLLSDELGVINMHGTEINNFVNAGGGLFSMGESPAAGAIPYGWLISLLPGLTVVDVGAGGIGSALTLTPEGELAFPGLTSADLSAGPWHNYFDGNFGGLSVLATAPDLGGVTRAIILGGGAGTSIVPPPGVESCEPATLVGQHTLCIARDARYWFTHTHSDDPDCATLLRAIQAAGGELCLGFIKLPQDFRNSDSVKDSTDALIEALGLYWKDQGLTGESNGTQTRKLSGQPLCRARKKLAVELIAAIANNALLGTEPGNCTFVANGVTNSFPADLIERAGAAAAGEDVIAIRQQRLLLKKFNQRQLLTVDDLALVGLKECPPTDRRTARSAARDPTTQNSCPGVNDTVTSAQAITRFPFRRTLNLMRYTDALASPLCAIGGREAFWKITPAIGPNGAQFTVDTFGSNFDTLLSVWRGTVGGVLTPVACNDNAGMMALSRATFTTDGTNIFFIVAEGVNDAFGSLKIRVTSP
jgi:hypothetical protein